MRIILISFCLLLSSFVFAQNKIAGKWKPVYFTMDKIISGDIKMNKVILSDTIDVMFKDDKDPAASKELMQMMADIMLEKMKNNEQEFLLPDIYIETDTKRNSTDKGNFSFDESAGLLTIKTKTRAISFVVSFKNNNLVLASELINGKGKKGTLIIEYEKI
jgi:hypothetical protein